jgi:hypothetical protein
MAAFWTVFTFGVSGPALTAHGSLDLKQEIQIQTSNTHYNNTDLASLCVRKSQNRSWKHTEISNH